ncbi:leukocyte receptor cluster member 1-like, partial [Pollicipes pollicipes]|uniref:leukocyte receptor cluster member 1-like n=1 Tax=Pollicipes pollicipes TaxID=41117 RepID=UPI0018853589
MNILPKKRWHVRTKENIARVRRDEANAAAEEKERLRRVALAEQEFRTTLLRNKAADRRAAIGEAPGGGREKLEVDFAATAAAKGEASIVTGSGHINFFQHLESGEKTRGPNEEYVQEQKEEREKYEKSIGYLTYLGQGSREETKQKAWFESLPTDRARHRQEADSGEVKKKVKDFEDPLNVLKKKLVDDAKRETAVKPAPLPPPRPTDVKTSTVRQLRDPGSDGELHSERKKHRKEKKKKHKKERKKEKKGRGSEEPRWKGVKRSRRRRRSSSSDASPSEDDAEAEATAARGVQLERLRAERLLRERAERERADALLRRLRGEAETAEASRPPAEPRLTQRYNAQFNPYLARQNYRERSDG